MGRLVIPIRYLGAHRLVGFRVWGLGFWGLGFHGRHLDFVIRVHPVQVPLPCLRVSTVANHKVPLICGRFMYL